MQARDIGKRLRALLGVTSTAVHQGEARPTFNVLVVCMGNLCRSPMACVVANAAVRRIFSATDAASARQSEVLAVFKSAGTHAEPLGEQPDSRARAALLRRGYVVDEKAPPRPVAPTDFDVFDLVLAMDQNNLADLRRMCPPEHAHKLRLFLDSSPGLEGREVPDPYYSDAQGFEHVLDLCETGALGVIFALQRMSSDRRHGSR